MFQEMREKHHQGMWERAISGCVVLVYWGEPHTSVTGFAEVVCMYVCLLACAHMP